MGRVTKSSKSASAVPRAAVAASAVAGKKSGAGVLPASSPSIRKAAPSAAGQIEAAGRGHSKEGKRLAKKTQWADKLGALSQAKTVAAARAVAARKEGKHAVVGDLAELHDALSGAIADAQAQRRGGGALAHTAAARAAEDAASKRVQSRKGRTHARGLELTHQRAVLAHAGFQHDPIAAIRAHLVNQLELARSTTAPADASASGPGKGKRRL